MTKEEYAKFKEDFNTTAIAQHTENQNLIDAKETVYKLYTTYYMKETLMYSYNVYDEPLDDIMSELDNLKEKTDKFKNYPEFFFTITGTAYSDYDSATIDEVIFQASWVQPMDYDQLQSAMKYRFRMELGEALRPSSVATHMSSMAECKAIQMFEEDELTWKGLQRMTYGECDL